MVDLSICIVTFHARDYLQDCLKSIFSNPPRHSIEIIVVDNKSDDGTIEMLTSDYPEVKIIQNQCNDGYTRPMNQALRCGSGKILVQLNPDTILQPESLDIMFDYMHAHPEIGICTPKILNKDGSMQWQCRRGEARPWDVIAYFTRLSRYFPKNPLFSGYLMTYKSEDEIYEVKAVSGACMFIRREVVEKIGYLDETYFAYQEDTDFCFRTRLAGWKIMYFPTVKIIHYGAEGGTRVHPYRSAIAWHRSYFIYYQKWLARDYFFLMNWLFYALMGVKFCMAMVKIFFSSEKYPSTRKPI
jgi:GT2 family glycosyltransferase